MSTFGGIQQALSSLSASQYGLQIVSQNISNASTAGYTRQGVDLAALDPVGGVPRRYVSGGGPSGVTVVATSRLNDPIVDGRARMEHARGSQTDTAATQLGQIESIFSEPSDTGLASQLNQFWSDWANVANSPADGAARTVVLQDAGSVANTLNAMSQSLSDVSSGTAQSLASDVAQANTAAQSLDALNTQIQLANRTGIDHNALLDQRDQLLDQLASLVGGVATINSDGSANVRVGASLADGSGGYDLVTAADPTTSAPGSVQALAVTGSDATTGMTIGGTAFSLTGGSAASSVTTLTSTTTGVPHFTQALDAVAQALNSMVNTAQTAGYDQNGQHPADPIFTGTTAGTISVTMTDPSKIAASGTASTGGNLDGSNALAVSKTGSQVGSPDAKYATLVGDIGSQSQLAQQRQATQDAITSGVDAQRQSASGVNMDEEVSNMLVLQRTYQASSRVLNVMDSMLNTLINQMGVS